MDENTTYQNGSPRTHTGFGETRSSWRRAFRVMLEDYKMKRGLIFGGILVAALAAFEMFNFSTTDFALRDFLGDERFLGVRWATILAIAFCGIDFAGLARLFTPEQGKPVSAQPAASVPEVWYLLGAWFLGATLNAIATWWAVTLALLERSFGNEVLSREALLTYVPVFVAVLVWLTRILIIGTFSVAGERLFTQVEKIARETRSADSVRGQAVSHAPAGFGPDTPMRIIGGGESLHSSTPPSAGVRTVPLGPHPAHAPAIDRLTRPAPKPPFAESRLTTPADSRAARPAAIDPRRTAASSTANRGDDSLWLGANSESRHPPAAPRSGNGVNDVSEIE